jgi:hypothetical protein
VNSVPGFGDAVDVGRAANHAMGVGGNVRPVNVIAEDD